MLIDHTLFGVEDKIKIALERIRVHEPAEGYYFADSFGKDSVCVRRLLQMAEVKFDAHHNLTCCEPPELIRFGRKHHPETMIHRPRETMWQLIERKGMPPSRFAFYCCEQLKENMGGGRVIATGIRREESRSRSVRRMIEPCLKDVTKIYLHPIIDWNSEDVWTFIRVNTVPYCPLYDEGWRRLGCVMCPKAGTKQMRREAERWPKIADAYLRCFRRTVTRHQDIQHKHPYTWQSGDAMYEWWLSDRGDTRDDDSTPALFV